MLAKVQMGGGQVDYAAATGKARLVVPPTDAQQYSNAHRRLSPTSAAGGRLQRRFHQRPTHWRVRARTPRRARWALASERTVLSGAVLGSPSVAWFFYASPPSTWR
jgi:hypothetical protein